MGDVKEPEYSVVKADPPFEIRRYAPMIVAEVQVAGERKAAINEGFRILADYIFGKNVPARSIAMTAPVLQSQKIAMTAPVLQKENSDPATWTISFVMPQEFTMDTLPKPVHDRITIKEVEPRHKAVVRFSGWVSDTDLVARRSDLTDWLTRNGYKFRDGQAPVYAFYNPPWTLPFLRRNEVFMDIEP